MADATSLTQPRHPGLKHYSELKFVVNPTVPKDYIKTISKYTMYILTGICVAKTV